MSIFSDDFSSYSVGAGVVPPWEQLGPGANVIAGGFRGQGLQFQSSGGIRRNTQANFYNDLSVYYYFNFPNAGFYQHTILELLNGIATPGPTDPPPIMLYRLGFENDGTITMIGPGTHLDNTGTTLGISLYPNKWYFIQINVKFDVGGTGFVTVESQVALDGTIVLDTFGPQNTTQNPALLSNGSASVNKFDFRDQTNVSLIDDITVNSPRDSIPTYPNPAVTFKARASQLIIEPALLLHDDTPVRASQMIIEHSQLPDNERVLITQMIIEIATAASTSRNGRRVKEA